MLDDGTKIDTRMLIWTAGTTPAPVVSSLPCELQRGRVVANESLQVPDFRVFGRWATARCARPLESGKFYPPTAQHAIRQAVRAREEHRRGDARRAAAAF